MERIPFDVRTSDLYNLNLKLHATHCMYQPTKLRDYVMIKQELKKIDATLNAMLPFMEANLIGVLNSYDATMKEDGTIVSASTGLILPEGAMLTNIKTMLEARARLQSELTRIHQMDEELLRTNLPLIGEDEKGVKVPTIKTFINDSAEVLQKIGMMKTGTNQQAERTEFVVVLQPVHQSIKYELSEDGRLVPIQTIDHHMPRGNFGYELRLGGTLVEGKVGLLSLIDIVTFEKGQDPVTVEIEEGRIETYLSAANWNVIRDNVKAVLKVIPDQDPAANEVQEEQPEPAPAPKKAPAKRTRRSPKAK